MAGLALQLFPPASRSQRPMDPNKCRSGSPSMRPAPHINRPNPEPATDSADSARSSNHFHDLFVQAKSINASPVQSVTPPPPAVKVPRIHIPNSQSSTAIQQIYNSAVQPNAIGRENYDQAQYPQSQSSALSIQKDPRIWQSRALSPDLDRSFPPASSDSATLIRASSSAKRLQSTSPEEEVSMRSIFPVFDPTVPLKNQVYQPYQTSPRQFPRTQISRSPYAQRTYIPYNNLQTTSEPVTQPPFFTPSALLENLWLASNGQEDPAVQMYTLKMHRATSANPTVTFGTTPSLPFYSLGQSNFARGHEVPSIMNEVLIQRHHPTQPRVLPVACLDLIAPPSLNRVDFDPAQQEETILLTSIYPKLAALQALDAAATSPAASRLALCDPGAQSPEAQRLAEEVLAGTAQRECCTLAWIKGTSQHGNPWAQHIPLEGSYELQHPILGHFPISLEGDCSVINEMSSRPITAFYGHNTPVSAQRIGSKPASITLLNPFASSPTVSRTNAFSPLPPPPPRVDGAGRPSSMTPSEMSFSQLPTSTDITADDVMLARLDLTNDALILNVGVLSRFGNPFLVDVATSALLAVAVAEAARGRRKQWRNQDQFEPPPPSISLGHPKDDTARALKHPFVEGFHGFGGKGNEALNSSSLKRFASSMKSSMSSRSTSASFDKDIELGNWYGQENRLSGDEKKREERRHEKAPLLIRIIIGLLSFAFKSIIFVLELAAKIITGILFMILRNFGRL